MQIGDLHTKMRKNTRFMVIPTLDRYGMSGPLHIADYFWALSPTFPSNMFNGIAVRIEWTGQLFT
jgi:hypothetical protein